LIGFALMLLLIIAVTWNDFQRFFMRWADLKLIKK
jgi:regulator of sigma E protease